MMGRKKEGGALNAGVEVSGVCQNPRDVVTYSGDGGGMCEGAVSLTGSPHTQHCPQGSDTHTAAGRQTDHEGA